MMKLGFIGTGNMGGAMIHGILASGIVSPSQIYVSDISEEPLKKFQEAGLNTSTENRRTAQSADIIF